MLHGDIEESRVQIIDWLPPRPSATASPLHEIFHAYSELTATRAHLKDIATHNSRKHVYFTEQIAPGQLGSTGDLNLLDEFRRYTLTGKHSMLPPHMRMWANDGRRLESVNDAHLHWIRNEFEDSTATHVLPPNVEAHEMQPITVDSSSSSSSSICSRSLPFLQHQRSSRSVVSDSELRTFRVKNVTMHSGWERDTGC